ncbi:MAG: hypothetical protein ACM3SY_22075 [Candidatus Omnitrophota bacterium]
MKKLLLLLLFCAPLLHAHDIHYSLISQPATVVNVYYADGTKFNYESFEIYKPSNTSMAYMVGRTDAEGRIVFIPDEPGKWLIKTFSADGHGASIAFEVDPSEVTKEKKLDFFEKYARVSFGLGVMMLIFSIMVIFLRKKK